MTRVSEEIRNALPPDSERLPENKYEKLHSVFETAVDTKPLKGTLTNRGDSKAPQSTVVTDADGSFTIVTPVSAYKTLTVNKSMSWAVGIKNQLDAPVCVNQLGGDASWTALVEHNDNEYIVNDGIAGTQYRRDTRSAETWCDELFTSAVNTYAAAFLSGNDDFYYPNFIMSRDFRFVHVDHDVAHIFDSQYYSREAKSDVDNTVWHEAWDRLRTLATEIDTGERDLPSPITEHRQEILTANAREFSKEQSDD